MNKVILLGNIANDVELKQSQNGKNLTRFRIACRRSQNETDFIGCVAFDKTAELIAKHFTKGSRILVEGNIKTGSYDDQSTGKKVYTFDVYVSSIDFPEKAGQIQNAAPQTPAQPPQNVPQGYPQQGYAPAPAQQYGGTYQQPPFSDYPLPY